MLKKQRLYIEHMNESNQQNELENSSINYEVQTNRVVAKRMSFVNRVLNMILDLVYRLGKLIVLVAICIILSIGVTAIINPEIRRMILSYLPLR
jgi:hypothetical protein